MAILSNSDKRLSPAGQAMVLAYKNAWEQASQKGDETAMRQANKSANAVRENDSRYAFYADASGNFVAEKPSAQTSVKNYENRVDTLVQNGLSAQLDTIDDNYKDAARQANVNYKLAMKNADEQLEVKGKTGGVSDSAKIELANEFQNSIADINAAAAKEKNEAAAQAADKSLEYALEFAGLSTEALNDDRDYDLEREKDLFGRELGEKEYLLEERGVELNEAKFAREKEFDDYQKAQEEALFLFEQTGDAGLLRLIYPNMSDDQLAKIERRYSEDREAELAKIRAEIAKNTAAAAKSASSSSSSRSSAGSLTFAQAEKLVQNGVIDDRVVAALGEDYTKALAVKNKYEDKWLDYVNGTSTGDNVVTGISGDDLREMSKDSFANRHSDEYIVIDKLGVVDWDDFYFYYQNGALKLTRDEDGKITASLRSMT